MEPVNIITLILILGLEIMFIGHENNYPKLHLVGNIIMLIGWILNIIVVITQ